METTIYIDSLFVLNLITNYLLLLATAKISGLIIRRWRLALSAAIGGAYAVAVFLPGLMFLSALPVKIVFALLMSAVAFGVPDFKTLLRSFLLFLVVSFAFGGAVTAAWMIFGAGSVLGMPYLPIDLKTLLLAAGLCYLIIAVVFRCLAKNRSGGGLVDIGLSFEGRESTLRALVDTGNSLYDPMTNTPVLVAESERVIPLLPDELAVHMTRDSLSRPIDLLKRLDDLGYGHKFRLIPYKAVGVDSGLLLAFRPESVTVSGERRELLVALSPNSLGAGFSALVN